jgi:four helix bundle protein
VNIALKELREARIWIKMVVKANLLPEPRIADLLDECNQLCNILGRSVATARANKGRH